MSEDIDAKVSRLIHELQNGRRAAFDELLPLIYDQLRLLAHRQRGRWRTDTSLNTTALVHELYLKLQGRGGIGSHGREHFYAVAAKAMRHVLGNYLRDGSARKRGSGLTKISLDDIIEAREEPGTELPGEHAEMLAEIEQALQRYEQIDSRGTAVVECRFYGGMTIEETAAALGVSPRTVKRDWQLAQAWLHRETKLRP